MPHKLLLTGFLAILNLALWAQGTVIWSENFDSVTTALPQGWTQQTAATDGGWKVDGTSAHSSQYFTVPARAGKVLGTNDDKCNCNKSNEIVYLAPLDLSAQSGQLRLLFDLFFLKGSYQSKVESLKLLASTDGGTTWKELRDFSGTGGWRLVMVDLTEYAGQANVRLAFRYDDAADWLYGAMIDNIRVVIPDNVIRARLSGVSAGKYIPAVPTIITTYNKVLPGHQVALRGVVQNNGFPAITSYEIEVKLPNGDTEKYAFENLNLNLSQTHTFFIPYPTQLGVNNFAFNVRLINVNKVGDDDDSDNTGTASYSILGVEPQPNRKVVVEEGTGTWCVWCPRGAVMMDYLAKEYKGMVIPIAVHNGSSNPMRLTAYDSEFSKLLGGYPGGLVEREQDIDPLLTSATEPNFEMSLIEHLTWPAQVIMTQNVDWNPTIRRVSIRSSVRFLDEMNGDYRLAAVLIEDGVRGTSSGFNQANAYAGGGRGPMGGYENLPNPVPAAQMVYNHVARALMGGFKGAAGSVPTSNPAGSVMSHEFSAVVPATQNINNMHAVTMLIDQATGRIINAEMTPIPFVSTSSPEVKTEPLRLSMAPNPVVEDAIITVQLEETADVHIRVFNAMGIQVAERIYDNVSGRQFLPFQAGSLPNGMYTLVATAKGHVVSTPFAIQR
ncbi:MAG: Omp28-related outer membrane protein [Saprospiraceae bacterium]|nr:Omp28-related outer membrane protein [Saprospiraceae bacterium]MDW8229019.1 Omp28-related outer membrane protein [Saprospiraceae bacterium]